MSRNRLPFRTLFLCKSLKNGHGEEASILMVPGKLTTLLYADWIPQVNGVRRELPGSANVDHNGPKAYANTVLSEIARTLKGSRLLPGAHLTGSTEAMADVSTVPICGR